MKCSIFYLTFFIIEYIQASTRSSCPSVRLKNGRARYRQRGGFVQSTCNTGYILAGDRYMKCSKGKWEGVIPVCVRDTCKIQRSPVNGFVYPSHRGGVLNFFCRPGYELVGPATAFCDGVSWSTHLPICSVTNKTVSINCDFESEDICGWTHDLNHNFDWTRHSRSTPSAFIGTGPFYDHTLGYGKSGHYMYIEASAKNPKDVARLISPVNRAPSRQVCLVFWYHMYGESMGTLRVYLRLVNNPDWKFNVDDALWTRSGDHGARWWRGVVHLETFSEDFQIVFEAVRGGNYMSDTAIDDVSIESCDEIPEDETTTTTEETSDAKAYLETWSCYNRCGNGTPGDTCSCQTECYEQQTCCPDYEAYCLDFDASSSSTSTEITTIWYTDGATAEETTPTDAIIATEVEQDVVEIEAFTTITPSTTTRRITNSTTTRLATSKLPKSLTTAQILLPKLLPPKFNPPPPPKYDIPRLKPPVVNSTPAPKIVTQAMPKRTQKPKKEENEVLRKDPVNSVQLKPEKHADDTKVDGASIPTFAIIGSAILIVAILIVASFKLRRRVSRACDSMRMRRGGACDSQSDVRFLTSDEVLDFSLASSTL